jgi:hypothetical protein
MDDLYNIASILVLQETLQTLVDKGLLTTDEVDTIYLRAINRVNMAVAATETTPEARQFYLDVGESIRSWRSRFRQQSILSS